MPDQQPKRNTQRQTQPEHGPRTLQGSKWSEWVFSAALAAIFLVFGMAILMDKEGREQPRSLAATPLFIGELHPNISDVIEKAPEDGALEITLVEPAPMYPADVVVGFASDALVVLRRMREFFPQLDNRVVRFVVKAPLHPTDTGSNGMAPLLSIEFERGEVLAEVTAPEFTYQDLLNETLVVRYLNDRSGSRYLGAFCRDPLSRPAADFCERQVLD